MQDLNWYVPTQGDHNFLAVKSTSRPKTFEEKKGWISARMRTAPRASQEWKGVAETLVDLGILREMPETHERFATAVFESDQMYDEMMLRGADSEYRKASVSEANNLDSLPLGMWPLSLMQGDSL